MLIHAIPAGKETTAKLSVIAGTTSELNTPVSRNVRVYSRNTGALIGTTKSDENGRYKVYLPVDSAYTIISIDENKVFNAAIQDNVVPK